MKTIRKFLFLGAATTAIDYAVYSLCIVMGMHYVPAIVLGYGAGLWANFIVGRRFIFTRGIKVSSAHTEFLAVVSIAVGGVLINIIIVKMLSDMLLALNPLVSRVVAIVIVFFWNFFMRKKYVYH